jgi:hypothetical protein
MARVPVQKQTMGIHSVLSEPELFSGQPNFPSNGNETQSLFTRSIQVLWGVQLCPGLADPDISKDHSALIFKVERALQEDHQRGIRRKLFTQRHGVASQ